MNRYVIDGGKTGKERLQLMSRVLLPTTSHLLNQAGLRSGMTCLDIGCGGGHVTLLLADLVGPQGKVIGVDMDPEILALARQDAETDGHHHVEFRTADAYRCQGEREHDLVYARFLLTHLSEPEKCLDAMLRACKPDGVVVIEDIDFTGHFCYPPCTAYERYLELYQQVVHRRGGDPNIGLRLPSLLRQAGAEQVQVRVIQPVYLEGEGKFIAAITMERIAGAVIAEGLADEAEVEQIVSGLNEAAADSTVLLSLPRLFQVWGKPG